MKGSIEENAEKFINAEKGVETVEEAIEGAKDIACEIISDNAEIRKALRDETAKNGVIISIFAVKAMQDAGLLPNKEIEFIFNCDEEIGTASGSKLYAQEAKDADYAFVFEGGEKENDKDGFVTARRGVILSFTELTRPKPIRLVPTKPDVLTTAAARLRSGLKAG